MISLLNLLAGTWKKNDVAAQSPAAPTASVPAVPRRPATSLEERQHLLAHHVRLVARGMANGLCVYGNRPSESKALISPQMTKGDLFLIRMLQFDLVRQK